MYVMKPLIAPDMTAVDRLIAARMEFQLAKGHLPRGEGPALRDAITRADARGDTPGAHDGRTAIGMWDCEQLVAAFLIQHAAPRNGWTVEEREQPTLPASHALSLPGQTILGRLATLWLSDYAARQHHQPLVRCVVRDQALAWRLVRTCRWLHVREVTSLHGTLHLMQRSPERVERLEVVLSSHGVPDLGPEPVQTLHR